MTGKIFLSYRREDDMGFALALFARLEQSFSADQLFMDVEAGVQAGEDFVRVLEEQVNACDAMLVLIGPQWLTVTDGIGRRRLDNPEDFVRIEVESALRLGKRVIPVLLHKTEMPRAEALPEQLRPLARRNAVGLTRERFRADAQGLIKALERAFADAEATRQQAATAAAEEQGRDAERVAKAEEAARSEKGRTRLEAWNHERVFLALEKRGEKIKDSSKKDIYVQLYKQDTNSALLYRQDSRYEGRPLHLNRHRSASWNENLFRKIEPYIDWVSRDNKGPGKEKQNWDHYRVRDWDGFAAALGLDA
jgi:hypothetical protein